MTNPANFWNGAGSSPVQPTPGEAPAAPGFPPNPPAATPNPINLINGTAQADPNQLQKDASNINPNILQGTPPGFNLPPGDPNLPGDFAQWNTGFQTQYLQAHFGKDVPAQLGPTGTSESQQVWVMLSGDGTKVYDLNQLQVADFATMPLADQNAIVGSPFFKDVLAGDLGLSPIDQPSNPPTTPPTTQLQQMFLNSLGTIDTEDPTKNFKLPQPTLMTPDDVSIFRGELIALQNQMTSSGAVFSPGQVQSAINAILSRFKNAAALGSVEQPVPPFSNVAPPAGTLIPSNTDPNQYANVNSLDNNQGIVAGYNSFMAAEKQIVQNQRDSMQLAKTGTLTSGGQQLDAPTLIAFFMMKHNESQGAVDIQLAQMINQQNNLLACYTEMQQIVASVEQSFTDTTDSKAMHDILADPKDSFTDAGDDKNTTAKLLASFTPAQMQIISMFQKGLGVGGQDPALNPIEQLSDVTRPTQDLMSPGPSAGSPSGLLIPHNKTFWDGFGTRLTNAITQINQVGSQTQSVITENQQTRTQFLAESTDAMAKLTNFIETSGRGWI